ncbi:hypothetical protein BC832DRAFT_241342 [Gaertneriomyces semiglobifer]|nr:hypothetical protein BC832DRAFT_241342 [Gaertneriomyces semiglobifer]
MTTATSWRHSRYFHRLPSNTLWRVCPCHFCRSTCKSVLVSPRINYLWLDPIFLSKVIYLLRKLNNSLKMNVLSPIPICAKTAGELKCKPSKGVAVNGNDGGEGGGRSGWPFPKLHATSEYEPNAITSTYQSCRSKTLAPFLCWFDIWCALPGSFTSTYSPTLQLIEPLRVSTDNGRVPLQQSESSQSENNC